MYVCLYITYVGDLLEEDGDESGVEGAHEAVLGHQTRSAAAHAGSVRRAGARRRGGVSI